MKTNEISPSRLLYLKKKKKTTLLVHIVRISLLVGLIFFWELLARLQIIDSFLMSMPSKIVETILDLSKSGELFMHVGVTLYETILGFLIATTLGTLLAILLYLSTFLRRVSEPYIVVLNSLPKIALGPIIIVWFGAGTKAIVFMAIIITIIVTIITMQNAFLSTDKGKLLLMRSLGATKMQILTKLVIPSSIPSFVSCLKINVGMSWIGSIMGEYLVSRKGIGYLIVYGGQVFKLDLVMSATVILCILAGLMYASISLIEKGLKKYH